MIPKTAEGTCLCLLGEPEQFKILMCQWVLVCSWQLLKRSLMLQSTQMALELTVIGTELNPTDGGWPNCSGTAEVSNSGLHQPLQAPNAP